MSNAGLNAIYIGGFARDLQVGVTPSVGNGRRRHGRGFMDLIKKGQNYLKDNKLISTGLTKLAAHAINKGYGRRRKHGGRRHRKH